MQATRRANGRVGGTPRVLRDIVKAFRRPPIRPLPVRLRDRNGGFPMAFGQGAGCVPHGLRCPASPRHGLLAENLGKPSLWVIINEIWYKRYRGARGPRLGLAEARAAGRIEEVQVLGPDA